MSEGASGPPQEPGNLESEKLVSGLERSDRMELEKGEAGLRAEPVATGAGKS